MRRPVRGNDLCVIVSKTVTTLHINNYGEMQLTQNENAASMLLLQKVFEWNVKA